MSSLLPFGFDEGWHGDGKCATGDVHEQLEKLGKSARPTGFPLPNADREVLSPSGRFKVRYDTRAGFNIDPAYAEAVARFADEAYRFEIEEMGFAKPPYTTSDSTYHIYLQNTGAQTVYGFTAWIDGGQLGNSPSGLSRMRTFIVMDNDYAEEIFRTKGLAAARITVFHEFHHVVQFGSYGDRQGHNYFQEMSSTWMEMMSDPSVDDYLQYLGDYFRGIDLRFDRIPANGKYGQVAWMEFLSRRRGAAVIREVWEEYRDRTADPLQAFEETLNGYNTTFCQEYARFGAQVFFTGVRTSPTSPFADASAFPAHELRVVRTAPGIPQTDLVPQPASITLIATGFGRDTTVLSIARDGDRSINSGIEEAVIHTRETYQVTYEDPARFCDTLATLRGVVAEVLPQPFLLGGEDSRVRILASTVRRPVTARLDIHSVSMEHLRRIESSLEPLAGSYYFEWDGRDASGKFVPSGVYLYSVDADGEERTGKMVVVRK